MRTYTRKRPDYQEIESVHELCRLCLGKSDDTIPIFTDSSENVCATLALRIMICVGLEISREDSLPNIICAECHKELDRCYRFRKKCEVTYQKLKSHVLAVKERQHNKAFLLKKEGNDIENNKNVTESEKKGDDDMKFVVKFDKDQLAEVDVVHINGVSQLQQLGEKLADEAKVDFAEIKVISGDTEIQGDNKDATGPDISGFITTLLIEMGLITPKDNGLAFTDQSIKTVELETGDGNEVTFELLEENEEILENNIENRSNTTETDPVSEDGSDVVIQYVTANYKTPLRAKKDIVIGNNKMPSSWCSTCGKRLASRSALVRHERVHTGERPYECADCGRTFTQREVLVRHSLVHAAERPFKCAQCGAQFTQRGALAAHARGHAPPHARALALHRCTRCPKVFLYASGLSRHMMMHNGRVYVCGSCDRQFKDKSSLLRHLKNTNHGPKDTTNT